MMSFAVACEIPYSWIDYQAGGEAFGENVTVRVGPGALVTQMELQLSFLEVVATKLEWAKVVRS